MGNSEITINKTFMIFIDIKHFKEVKLHTWVWYDPTDFLFSCLQIYIDCSLLFKILSNIRKI